MMTIRASIVIAMFVIACLAACSTGLKVDRYADAAIEVDAAIDARADRDVVVVDAAITDALVVDAVIADALVVDAAITDAVVGPTVCDGPDAAVPSSPIVVPDPETYLAAVAPLQTQVFSYPAVLEIPLTSCVAARFQADNVIGSAFLDMYRAANGDCVIWTGGFEEYIDHNGLPSLYCRFPASCGHVSVPSNMWGDLPIDSPWCVSSGFCLDCPEFIR